MKGRPHFTIKKKNGNGYDANHIRYARGFDGQWVVEFLCSGQATSLPVDDVESIEFVPAGATWCGECDEPLKSSNYTDPDAFKQ